jgi:hypothetical protein
MSEPQQLELLDWLAASSQLAFSGGCLTRDKFHPLHLTRVDPSCNMRRLHSLALATSLFGEAGVARH